MEMETAQNLLELEADLRRRLGEKLDSLMPHSLHEFVRGAWHVVEPHQRFFDNWHIRAICHHLEAVSDGRIENLLCNVPPGTMKSLLVCVFWPAWEWIKRPWKRFMFSSYAEFLSLRDSSRCRALLASAWYQERWPLRFSDSQDAKGKFENANGGWRMVGSISGKGIGEHPDYNVADDPHNVLQALSEAELLTAREWFEGVFLVRGQVRDVKRVLIMQRLASQDCSGLALEKKNWVHICLPMRYEEPDELTGPRMAATPIGWTDPRTKDGELLWPDKYPEAKVAEMEDDLGLYNAAGQLQQRPTPRGGGRFQRAWFLPALEEAPSCTCYVRYWDKAGTKGGKGPQTAGVLLGLYLDQAAAHPSLSTKYVVLDVATYRLQAAEREAVMIQTGKDDRHSYGHVKTWVEQEPGSGGKESAENTVGAFADQGLPCEAETVTGKSKEVRADPVCSAASVGKVRILKAAWNRKFLDQVEQFPLGKLKDIVDGLSGAFNHCHARGAPPRNVARDRVNEDKVGTAERRGSATLI